MIRNTLKKSSELKMSKMFNLNNLMKSKFQVTRFKIVYPAQETYAAFYVLITSIFLSTNYFKYKGLL